ncbi:uncharacterized protein PHACADRAFT_103469, partial [Phanerochaete carnosa HHB-10118-sp]
VLGGLSTLAASYLAKARGSGEPEHSTACVKDLENFVREAEAWVLDHGHRVASATDDNSHSHSHSDDGAALDMAVARFRARFEEIMGKPPTGLAQMFKEKMMSPSSPV